MTKDLQPADATTSARSQTFDVDKHPSLRMLRDFLLELLAARKGVAKSMKPKKAKKGKPSSTIEPLPAPKHSESAPESTGTYDENVDWVGTEFEAAVATLYVYERVNFGEARPKDLDIELRLGDNITLALIKGFARHYGAWLFDAALAKTGGFIKSFGESGEDDVSRKVNARRSKVGAKELTHDRLANATSAPESQQAQVPSDEGTGDEYDLPPAEDYRAEVERLWSLVRAAQAVQKDRPQRDRALSPVPIIRIGCGLALVPRFVPEVLREYRARLKAGDDFHAIVTIDKPMDLRARVDDGTYDLVITAFSEEEFNEYGTIREDAKIPLLEGDELRMHLLFDREVKNLPKVRSICNEAEFASLIENRVVILPARARAGSLRPTTEQLQTAKSVFETEQWFEALAMIKSNLNACCIAFPQMFPPDQRSRYKSFALGDRFHKLKLGAMISRRNATTIENGVIDRKKKMVVDIRSQFVNVIRAMADEGREESTKVTSRRTAHVSLVWENLHAWTLGRVEDFVLTPQGYIRCSHILEDQVMNREQRYTINGHVSIRHPEDATGKDDFFLVWRGYQELRTGAWGVADDTKDAYSIALHLVEGELNGDPSRDDQIWIGTWSGRTLYKNAPYVGYFVFYPESLHQQFLPSPQSPQGYGEEDVKSLSDYDERRKRLTNELTRRVHDFVKEHKLQLKLPDRVGASRLIP